MRRQKREAKSSSAPRPPVQPPESFWRKKDSSDAPSPDRPDSAGSTPENSSRSPARPTPPPPPAHPPPDRRDSAGSTLGNSSASRSPARPTPPPPPARPPPDRRDSAGPTLGNSSASRSPIRPTPSPPHHPPPARRDSPALTQTTTRTRSYTSAKAGSSDSRSPADTPGQVWKKVKDATPPPPQDTSPARQDSSTPTATPMETISSPRELLRVKDATFAGGNSSASPAQPPGTSSPQSMVKHAGDPPKTRLIRNQSPSGPAAASAGVNSSQACVVKSPSEPAAASAGVNSSQAWVVKSPSEPAAASAGVNSSQTWVVKSPNGPQQPTSPTGGSSVQDNGSAGAARYNLRPRGVNSREQPRSASCPPPPKEPAAPSTPATPPLRKIESSLATSDDERTLEQYRAYLQKHERPNAITALLSGEPLKLTINFKKLLKSNRSLAHTICNHRERIWSSLLEVSRNFLLQVFKEMSAKNLMEGMSDETIQDHLLKAELAFMDLPSNICTLLDFLSCTPLTTLEDILEGHVTLVLTEEGRRLLHSLVRYLIAHHKLGLAFEGNWEAGDWDVEDSRTVSLAKEPVQFVDDKVAEKDLDRLDISIVPMYCKRGHLTIPRNQHPKLLYLASFRNDLRDRSHSMNKLDYHELISSHPFIMPSEARFDLLIALYRFFVTMGWGSDKAYQHVFGNTGEKNWPKKIRNGRSFALRNVYWYGWDRRSLNQPYQWFFGDLLVYQRHALVHVRNYEKDIRKIIALELLVASTCSRFLPKLIRLMFEKGKMNGEMRRRWDIYVGAGVNKRV